MKDSFYVRPYADFSTYNSSGFGVKPFLILATTCETDLIDLEEVLFNIKLAIKVFLCLISTFKT